METTFEILYEEEYFISQFDEYPEIRIKLLEFHDSIHFGTYRIAETICKKRTPVGTNELLDDMSRSEAIRKVISIFDDLKKIHYPRSA